MTGVIVLKAPIIIPCKNRLQKNSQKLGINMSKPTIIDIVSRSKMLFLKNDRDTCEKASSTALATIAIRAILQDS